MRMGPLLVPLLRCSSLPHTLSLGPTKPAFQELIEYLGSSFHLTLRHALWPELSGLHMRCDLDPGNCRAPRVPPLGPPEVGHKRHRFQGPQQPLEVRPPGTYQDAMGLRSHGAGLRVAQSPVAGAHLLLGHPRPPLGHPRPGGQGEDVIWRPCGCSDSPCCWADQVALPSG
jgi:hypothetical protein